MRKIEERYYFAYGSNMNLGQMRFRCPDAEVVGNVRLEDYRLAFRGRAPGNGVATVLPEKGSCQAGALREVFVYTMNSPHKDVPARPSKFYLDGILEGCLENDLPTKAVMDAVKRTRQEMKKAEKQYTR